MLTKLYVDNFRSLVNLEFSWGRQHLLMGPNGSGKSTVFEVLEKLKDFLTHGVSADEAFGRRTLTRWQTLPVQKFGMEFSTAGGGVFSYGLAVKHPRNDGETLVEVESLTLNDQRVFEVRAGHVTLFSEGKQFGPFPLDPKRSFLGHGSNAPDLQSFRFEVGGVFVVRVDPKAMQAKAPRESPWLWTDLSNIASWYRGMGTQTGAFFSAFQELRQAMPGFKELVLIPTEEGRRLTTVWKDDNGEARYDFSELSDGQRALIGLYMVAHWLQESGGTLCLDEPDNFLALTEVQPLLSLLDGMEKVQTLVISHHPEVINGLARDHGLRFERHFNGPTRVTAFKAPPETLLTPAELVARGADDESP